MSRFSTPIAEQIWDMKYRLKSANGSAIDGSVEETWARIARALASVINLLDPNAIVLGGGLSAIERLYTDVPRQWTKYIFSDHVRTELLPPKFGDSSGVRGAAWLVNLCAS